MKIKNAPLEASNVAVLLEHIPIGQTRSIHSLQVKRVEADHYSIEGGPVVDLVDALSQVGSYSGKAHNPRVRDAVVLKHKSQPVSAAVWVAEIVAVMQKAGFPADVEDGQRVFEVLEDGDSFHRDDRNRSLWNTEPRGIWASELEEAVDKVHGYGTLDRQKVLRSNPTIGQGYALANPARLTPKGLNAEQAAEWATFRAAMKADRKKYVEEKAREQGLTVAQLREKERAVHAEHLAWRKANEAERREAKARLRKVTAAAKAAFKDAAKTSNPAAKFERGKAVGGGHREERGYFYEVLNSSGKPVALTTSKAEAEDVCANPKQLNLPKGTYSYRHVGGKKLVPTTSAGTRARRV